jgi:hypothetical protein
VSESGSGGDPTRMKGWQYVKQGLLLFKTIVGSFSGIHVKMNKFFAMLKLHYVAKKLKTCTDFHFMAAYYWCLSFCY